MRIRLMLQGKGRETHSMFVLKNISEALSPAACFARGTHHCCQWKVGLDAEAAGSTTRRRRENIRPTRYISQPPINSRATLLNQPQAKQTLREVYLFGN